MSFPYMPLYTGSYLKKTRKLNTEQHGAYLLILMEMWNHEGELAFDHEELAKIAGISARRWPAIWDKLSPMFLYGKGVIRQERLDEELEKAAELTVKRRNAGRKGGFTTSLKSKGSVAAGLQQSPSRLQSESESYSTTAPVERAPAAANPVHGRSEHEERAEAIELAKLKILNFPTTRQGG